MKKIIVVLLMLFNSFVFAADNETILNENNSEEPEFYEVPIEGIKSFLGTAYDFFSYNVENNSKNGFSAHKPNYFIYTYSNIAEVTRHDVYTVGDSVTESRKKSELKFQISVKQRFLKFYGWALYFAYSQKSFWQAMDLNKSRPFRETNFNPEVFVRTKTWRGWRFDFGFEHESNGREEPESKSWNRIYFTPYFENSWMVLSLKTWYRIPEKEKEYPMDPEGDENPDIHHYYGYGELRVAFKNFIFDDLRVASMARYNIVQKKGAIQVDLTYPIKANSMYWYIQYWDGYGESLVDYDVNQRKIGVGFMFTR